MLYQTNTVLTVAILVMTSLLLFKYVEHHKESIFFWVEKPCNHGADCVSRYFDGPVKAKDPLFLEYFKEEHLVPPPENYSTEGFSIYTPVWKKLVNWDEIQEGLKDVWQNQPPGFFVEIGAVDGYFMSQTIYLEKNLSWTGLLIEPDPRSYGLLKQAYRNTWLSDACIYPDSPGKRSYWLRTMDEDLPFHFQQILLARSKLNEETMVGDEERGGVIWTMCAPLSSVLLAGNFTSIDLLSIATGHDSDEEKIKEALHNKQLDIKTLLVQYPSSRYFTSKYPEIPGYVIDMGHSQLLIKFYVKLSHCKLVQKGNCKTMNYYDTVKACVELFCMNHLTVWTYDPKDLKSLN